MDKVRCAQESQATSGVRLMTGLPSHEEMLEDLSQVEGLDFFWQMLSMVDQVMDGLITQREREIIDANKPIPYALTDTGRSLLDGK